MAYYLNIFSLDFATMYCDSFDVATELNFRPDASIQITCTNENNELCSWNQLIKNKYPRMRLHQTNKWQIFCCVSWILYEPTYSHIDLFAPFQINCTVNFKMNRKKISSMWFRSKWWSAKMRKLHIHCGDYLHLHHSAIQCRIYFSITHIWHVFYTEFTIWSDNKIIWPSIVPHYTIFYL